MTKKKTKEVQELKSKIVDKLLNANINVKQQRKKEYVNVNNISKPDYVTAIDLAKSRGYSDIVEKLRSSISSQYKSGSFDLFGLFGGGNMQHKYNGRTYKVRVGPKGGKYILVNKQKKYL